MSRNKPNLSVGVTSIVIGCLLVTVCCIWEGIGYQLLQARCGIGHLKRASDANTVEMARDELDAAIADIKKYRLTTGNSGIFFDTPHTDLAFWFKNIESARAELDKVNEESSQLEQSNVLLKLRETLIDHGQSGDTITIPANLEVYPLHYMFGYTMLIGVCSIVFGTGLMFLAVLWGR